MRLVALALVGCTGHYGSITIQPADGPPLGVGLTQHFTIEQDVCDDGPPDPGGCDPQNPSHATVSVRTGDAVRVTDVTPSSFDVVGVAPGSETLDITGDAGEASSFAITVSELGSTTLFVRRESDDHARRFPDVHDPVQVLWSSTVVVEQHDLAPDGNVLEQHDLAPDGNVLSGTLPLALFPDGTDVAFGAECDCYGTGFHLGIAHLSSPLAALSLHVVDETAIADVTIDNSPDLTEVALVLGASTEVFLIPSDAVGRPIIGRGRDPEIRIADPSIATVYANTGNTVRAVTLLPQAPGTTTMDVTWGAAHKTFTLRVATS
jgi:hypothetical protein